ncbi:MAG: hypothetical protein AABZ12_03640 [Planctomycetota bacterium]
MAGGPIFPFSAYPTSSRAFANVHVGAGANSKHEEGMGVAASIASDTVWRLRFPMPPALPTGTAKLRLVGLAAAPAASKDAKVNPKWASVAAGEDPSSATLTAEGTTTITWATTDGDKYKEAKIVLDADTIVAGEIVAMDLVFEATGWTLDKVSTWQASAIWES